MEEDAMIKSWINAIKFNLQFPSYFWFLTTCALAPLNLFYAVHELWMFWHDKAPKSIILMAIFNMLVANNLFILMYYSRKRWLQELEQANWKDLDLGLEES